VHAVMWLRAYHRSRIAPSPTRPRGQGSACIP
jgi:hypothetical protein